MWTQFFIYILFFQDFFFLESSQQCADSWDTGEHGRRKHSWSLMALGCVISKQNVSIDIYILFWDRVPLLFLKVLFSMPARWFEKAAKFERIECEFLGWIDHQQTKRITDVDSLKNRLIAIESLVSQMTSASLFSFIHEEETNFKLSTYFLLLLYKW